MFNWRNAFDCSCRNFAKNIGASNEAFWWWKWHCNRSRTGGMTCSCGCAGKIHNRNSRGWCRFLLNLLSFLSALYFLSRISFILFQLFSHQFCCCQSLSPLLSKTAFSMCPWTRVVTLRIFRSFWSRWSRSPRCKQWSPAIAWIQECHRSQTWTKGLSILCHPQPAQANHSAEGCHSVNLN